MEIIKSYSTCIQQVYVGGNNGFEPNSGITVHVEMLKYGSFYELTFNLFHSRPFNRIQWKRV